MFSIESVSISASPTLQDIGEVVADARYDERVRVAGDDLREPANPRPSPWVLGKERRVGMGFVQVLDECQRRE